MTALRIVVKIPTGTYPELCADLAQVSTRERAERMRLLAMIGLISLSGSGQGATNASVSINAIGEPPAKPPERSAASRLIQKLSSGLQD